MEKTGDSSRVFGREDPMNLMAEEHPYGDLGQIIALILFLGVWASDSFIFRFSTNLSGYVPLIIRFMLAALSVFIAVYLTRSGHRLVFNGIRSPQQVIKTGSFGIVRHPIYLSVLLFYIGLIFLTFSLISVALFSVIFVFYDYIARFEERVLQQKLGREYTEYVKKVPKWFPRLKS